MRNLFIIIFFLIVAFTNNGVASVPGSVHEYTVDLYYANGVLADAEDASLEDWTYRADDLRAKYPSLKQALKYGEAKLSYNASYLWGVSDFFEVITQFKNET